MSFKTKRMGALFLQTWTEVAWRSPQASRDMKQMVPSIHGQVPAPLGAPTSQQCAATLLCSLPSTPLQLLTTPTPPPVSPQSSSYSHSSSTEQSASPSFLKHFLPWLPDLWPGLSVYLAGCCWFLLMGSWWPRSPCWGLFFSPGALTPSLCSLSLQAL